MYFMVIGCILLTVTDSLMSMEKSYPSSTTSLLTEVFPTSTYTSVNKRSTTAVFPELIINKTEVTRSIIRRVSTASRSRKVKNNNLVLMGKNLNKIPEGSSEIVNINLSYNNIKNLTCFVFWNNSFSGVRKMDLQQNKIANIHVSAFRGIRHVTYIDLSNNKISSLDPYTFKGNNRLQKLILMDNQISFDRLQTFLLSYSIDYLVLSNNKIDQIYELTFLGLPNLKSLTLNDNSISEIAPNSFKALTKLHYLSLANTGIYRLEEQMFLRLPKIINLSGTPLSVKFEPPLRKISGESVRDLLSIARLLVDEDDKTK